MELQAKDTDRRNMAVLDSGIKWFESSQITEKLVGNARLPVYGERVSELRPFFCFWGNSLFLNDPIGLWKEVPLLRQDCLNKLLFPI
jgi:hypothetical protein